MNSFNLSSQELSFLFWRWGNWGSEKQSFWLTGQCEVHWNPAWLIVFQKLWLQLKAHIKKDMKTFHSFPGEISLLASALLQSDKGWDRHYLCICCASFGTQIGVSVHFIKHQDVPERPPGWSVPSVDPAYSHIRLSGQTLLYLEN